MPGPKQVQIIIMRAQFGPSDKGHAIKGLVVCKSWDLELPKRSDPLFLSTIHLGMNVML